MRVPSRLGDTLKFESCMDHVIKRPNLNKYEHDESLPNSRNLEDTSKWATGWLVFFHKRIIHKVKCVCLDSGHRARNDYQ